MSIGQRRTGRAGWVAAACITGSILAGCGDATTPADSVPALAQQLDAVDTAIAHGDYGQARTAVKRLVSETAHARVEGRLDDAKADAILQAAAEVLDHLPAPSPGSSPSPTRSATPEHPEEHDEEGHSEEQSHEDKSQQHDPGDEGSDQGDGNGPSSGNGPDDGHGN